MSLVYALHITLHSDLLCISVEKNKKKALEIENDFLRHHSQEKKRIRNLENPGDGIGDSPG
jgi:hypothetical protein